MKQHVCCLDVVEHPRTLWGFFCNFLWFCSTLHMRWHLHDCFCNCNEVEIRRRVNVKAGNIDKIIFPWYTVFNSRVVSWNVERGHIICVVVSCMETMLRCVANGIISSIFQLPVSCRLLSLLLCPSFVVYHFFWPFIHNTIPLKLLRSPSPFFFKPNQVTSHFEFKC